jgi:hypothetical protein
MSISGYTTDRNGLAIAGVTAFLVSILAVLAFSALPASAASAWWQLSAGVRPASIQPGVARDEVQELNVDATGGTFTLTSNGGTFVAGSGIGPSLEQTTAPLAFDVPAAGGVGPTASVQNALEALPAIGAGNVLVSGGPAAGAPLIITFIGVLADQPLFPVGVNPGALTGASKNATLSEVTQGRADGEVYLDAENLGDGVLDAETGAGGAGGPVTIADVLPAGLKAVGIAATIPGPQADPHLRTSIGCDLGSLSCALDGKLLPYDTIDVRIFVVARAGAESGEVNKAAVSGGGAPAVSFSRPIVLSGAAPAFGVESFRTRFEEEGGALDLRAGSHPFQMTTTVTLNQGADTQALAPSVSGSKSDAQPVALPKDVFTKFPSGFIGNPTHFETCTLAKFLEDSASGVSDACPTQSAVGVASVEIDEPAILGVATFTGPLFNLEPYYGEPARFGFYIAIAAVPVLLDTSVRSGAGEGAVPGQSEDYGIDVNATNITQTTGLLSARITVWGVPGDPRHDNSRGWGCLDNNRGLFSPEELPPCLVSEAAHPPAFLTVPTSCAAPLQASVETDSWLEPEVRGDALPAEPLPTLEGCNRVPFSPTIQSSPTTNSASSSSGLDFNVDFKNEGLDNGEGLAQSHLKDTTVTLPEGFTINPSAGVGLVGCTPADYARETVDSLPGAGCPNESKLGTVEIETPLLTQKIHGSLYIAQPYENPFAEPAAGHPNGTLVALYIVAKNPETGILIKLAGKVTPNPVTGRLVTTFENNPQLPFSHFNFHFREGAQAPLITPATCGTYTTQAQLTSWSEPTAALTDSSSFEVTNGVGGGACPSGGVQPFNPGIESGMQNNNAGVFSPFYLHLTRTDGEQYISGFSTDLPPGLTGDLTGIPFCPEADIALARTKTGAAEEASPSCPAASQVGHTLVGTGVGAVLAYVPGKIYLAGPFDGAPFSLVSVTSAVVGPFDLGTVVLRFGLSINPYTAQVSVNPSSSEPIPTILDGIVTHVRDIRVYIERPGNAPFTLNPTSCGSMAIGSTLSAPGGASSTVTSPFQAASCANLKFAPKFAVSTSGKTSKANGASLHVALTYPSGPQGTSSDIAKVKVELPKQLPSRLTTLQKACTDAQFEANPAGCPSPSVIGSAKAVVPNIPEPLTGPVYFVSHGGEAFPSLEVVLQGYGVKVILVGTTFISRSGITSTTFKAVPDNPVTSFELTLPEGKYSALAANGNLCAETKTVTSTKKETKKVKGKNKKVTVKVKKSVVVPLQMPVEFIGQNGAELHQTTPVSVTGCTKAKPAAKKHSKEKQSKNKHGKKK